MLCHFMTIPSYVYLRMLYSTALTVLHSFFSCRMVEQELLPCLRHYGIRFYAYNPVSILCVQLCEWTCIQEYILRMLYAVTVVGRLGSIRWGWPCVPTYTGGSQLCLSQDPHTVLSQDCTLMCLGWQASRETIDFEMHSTISLVSNTVISIR